MEKSEYIDLLFKAALRKDDPNLEALDEVIKLVEAAIEAVGNKEGGIDA